MTGKRVVTDKRKKRVQALILCVVLTLNLLSFSVPADDTAHSVYPVLQGNDLAENDLTVQEEGSDVIDPSGGTEVTEADVLSEEAEDPEPGDLFGEEEGPEDGSLSDNAEGSAADGLFDETYGSQGTLLPGETEPDDLTGMEEDSADLFPEESLDGNEITYPAGGDTEGLEEGITVDGINTEVIHELLSETEADVTQVPGAVADEVMTEGSELQSEPAFEQSKVMDDVIVMVKAPEGTFPADAVLSVSRMSVNAQNQTDNAVDQVRDDTRHVVMSYTYDIKVLDPDTKEELQPADGKVVEVHFSMAQAADENLEAQVYHITEDDRTGELVAEELEVKEEGAAQASPQNQEHNADNASADETVSDEGTAGGASADETASEMSASPAASADEITPGAASEDTILPAEGTIVVETDGFSYYTVEFTYNHLEYVLAGNTSVALREVLESVGLTGEVTESSVSAPELFSVSRQEDGEWTVTALQAFDTTEWLKVTINDVEYEITVTDSVLPPVSYLYRDADNIKGDIRTCGNYTSVTDAGKQKEFSNGWYVFQNGITYEERCNVTGSDVNFIITDGCAVWLNEGIHIAPGAHLTIYGQEESSGCFTLKSTKNSPLGGNQGENCSTGSLKINGGSIDATGKNGAAAIGAGKEGSFGDITINGGYVVGRGGGDAAGIGGSEYGGPIATITINGGLVNATGGDKYGAGIGGGDRSTDGGEIIITGGTVKAFGGGGNVWHGILARGAGAGIGGGRDRTGPERITISGGSVTAEGSWYGAGIGGGYEGSSGDITITGGNVIVRSGDRSAGIGGGYARGIGDGKRVLITGGNVSVDVGETDEDSPSNEGAGIGGGGSGPQGGDVIIRGGNVSAVSWCGAGIGGGGSCGEPGGNVIISGGNVVATSKTGAGIGGGGPMTPWGDGYDSYEKGDGGNVTISGGNVLASSTEGGAAIGGGAGRDGGRVTITGGYTVATTNSLADDWVNHVKRGHSGARFGADGFAAIFHWLMQKALSHPVDKSPAAIGGGYSADRPRGGKPGTFYITGGTLIASSALKEVAAIGGASDSATKNKDSAYTLGTDIVVKYSDEIKTGKNEPSLKTAPAGDRYKILATKPYIVIECSHPSVYYSDSDITPDGHYGKCNICDAHLDMQQHSWDGSGVVCKVCGYRRRGGLSARIEDGIYSYTYTAREIKPEVRVTVYGKTLRKGLDYDLRYENNIDVGTASIKIMPKGVYAYSDEYTDGTINYYIRKAHLGRIELKPASYQYDGSEKSVPQIKVVSENNVIVSEYTLDEYARPNTNAGTYSFTVKAKEDSNFAGSLLAVWRILPRELKKENSIAVTLAPETFVYDGWKKLPEVTVTDNGLNTGSGASKELKKGEDYTVSYQNNVNAGTGTVIITGMGNYTGTIEETFTIDRAQISEVTLAKDQLTYNKTLQKVSVLEVKASVTETEYKLVPLSDCNISGDSGINPGNYTLTVSAKPSGNYKGSVQKSWSITGEKEDDIKVQDPKPINGEMITAGLSETEFVFDGEEKTPFVTVKDGDITLTGALEEDIRPDSGTDTSQTDDSSRFDGLDYTYEYLNNENAGTASVKITGRGKYTGERELSFTIHKAKIDQVQLSEYFLFYTGEEQYLHAYVMAGDMMLNRCSYEISGDVTDVTYDYMNAETDEKKNEIDKTAETVLLTNKGETGDYSVTIKANGDFTGSVTVPYYIVPRGTDVFDVKLSETEYVYDGMAKTPEVIVTDRNRILIKGKDYTVDYYDNIKAGTAKAEVAGIGNYRGIRTLDYTIAKAEIDAVDVSDTVFKYNGSEQTVNIVKVYADMTHTEDHIVPADDYMVTGNTAKYPGSYQMVVKAKEKSNYTGFVTVPYTIVSESAAVFTAELAQSTEDELTYDGNPKTPKVIVKYGETILKENTDYIVTYQNNVDAGTARAFVAGKGNYEGTRILTFRINKAPLRSVSLAEKSPLTYNGKLQAVTVQEVKAGTANNAAQSQEDSTKTWLTVPEEDYILTGNIGRSPGQYTVTVTAKDNSNYTGTATTYFSILPDNGVLWSEIDDLVFVYDGQEKRPGLLLYDGNELLVKGKDYEMSYSNNINAGVAAVLVRFLGKYAMTDEDGKDIIFYYNFIIDEAPIDTVVLEKGGILTYNGEEQKPVVTKVMSGNLEVPQGDYTVDVSPESEAGAYELTVTVTSYESNFTGSKTAEWRIVKAPEKEEQDETEVPETEAPETEAVGTAGQESSLPFWLSTTGQKKHSIDLVWTSVPGAVKYVVYGSLCGGKMKNLKKLGDVNQYTVKKTGSRLNQGEYYKFRIAALDKTGSVIDRTKVIHVVTRGGSYTNYSAVKVKDSVIRKASMLRPGQKLKLKASAVKQNESLKVDVHRGMRYMSDNKKVATVSSKGVIKAKAPGSCWVYAYNQSGTFARIKVVVGNT